MCRWQRGHLERLAAGQGSAFPFELRLGTFLAAHGLTALLLRAVFNELNRAGVEGQLSPVCQFLLIVVSDQEKMCVRFLRSPLGHVYRQASTAQGPQVIPKNDAPGAAWH